MHTQERLLPMADMPTNILTEGGLRVARCDFDGVINAEAEANARRFMDCWNALAGIDDPLAFVAAVRELRDSYHTACRDQPRSSLSGVCTRIENVIKLLPPETP